MLEETAARRCKIEPARDHPGPAARILLVEDEANVRRLMASVLRYAGYSVVEMANAEEALCLTAHAAGPFDLLVTDVVLPGVSGPELVSKLRGDSPDLAVLYVSGYSRGRTDVGYLEKPFGPTALLDAVGERLHSRTTSTSLGTSVPLS